MQQEQKDLINQRSRLATRDDKFEERTQPRKVARHGTLARLQQVIVLRQLSVSQRRIHTAHGIQEKVAVTLPKIRTAMRRVVMSQ